MVGSGGGARHAGLSGTPVEDRVFADAELAAVGPDDAAAVGALTIAPGSAIVKHMFVLLACAETSRPPPNETEAHPLDTGPFDRDGDGFAVATDCDDSRAEAWPDAPELCNGLDEDCDALVDEGQWYADNDGDGFGDQATEVDGAGCREGYIQTRYDCDDTDPLIYKGAVDVCQDGIDQDCDGKVNDPCDIEDADVVLRGEESMQVGYAIDNSGDFDGDGLDDLAIGAPRWYSQRAYVVFDAAERAGAYQLDALTNTFMAEGEDESGFGGQVVALADINGDGRDELAVGAGGGTKDTGWRGSVSMFLTVERGARLDSADAAVVLTEDGDQGLLGARLGAPGDVDTDGVDDLLVSTSSELRTYSGASLESRPAVVWTIEGYSFSNSAFSTGDLDGDGLVDLVVGDSSHDGTVGLNGAVRVFLGSGRVDGSRRVLEESDAIWEGVGYANRAGRAVVSGADANGKGYDDVLAGVPWAEGSDEDGGAAFLLTGSAGWVGTITHETQFLGVYPMVQMGTAVELADILGDTRVDVVVGGAASYAGCARAGGEVVIFDGASVAPGTFVSDDAPTSWAGFEPENELGTALAARGDQDGDGLTDLLVSDSGYARYVTGAVFLLLGPL